MFGLVRAYLRNRRRGNLDEAQRASDRQKRTMLMCAERLENAMAVEETLRHSEVEAVADTLRLRATGKDPGKRPVPLKLPEQGWKY